MVYLNESQKLELLHSRIIAEKPMVERSWRTWVTWSRVVGMSAVSWCPWYMMMMMVCTAVAMWHAQLYTLHTEWIWMNTSYQDRETEFYLFAKLMEHSIIVIHFGIYFKSFYTLIRRELHFAWSVKMTFWHMRQD